MVALQNKNFQRRCEFDSIRCDSIGSIQFNPNPFQISVSGLQIQKEAKKTPFLVPVFVLYHVQYVDMKCRVSFFHPNRLGSLIICARFYHLKVLKSINQNNLIVKLYLKHSYCCVLFSCFFFCVIPPKFHTYTRASLP